MVDLLAAWLVLNVICAVVGFSVNYVNRLITGSWE